MLSELAVVLFNVISLAELSIFFCMLTSQVKFFDVSCIFKNVFKTFCANVFMAQFLFTLYPQCAGTFKGSAKIQRFIIKVTFRKCLKN